MNTHPTPATGGPGKPPGPADLAALKATDALLDRLSRGGASAQDRQDPLVVALAQVRASLDDPIEQDTGQEISRLMDVLGERPLYLVDDAARQATPQDEPIWLSADEPAHVVDLADSRSGPGDVGEAGRGVGRPAAAVALPRQRPGWQRVLEHAALPAASVALLVALGSGVSAAVTGNPMSPVNGVGRVVSQLPGMENQQTTAQTITSAQAAILEAGKAAHAQQPERAASLLALAQKKVAQLPPGEQGRLSGQIAEVKQAMNDKSDPAMPTPDDPGVVVVAKPTSAPPKHSTIPTTPAPTTTPPTSPATTATPTPSESGTPSASATPSTAVQP